MARYWLAFCASEVGVSVSVVEVCPAMLFQVVAAVGRELPLGRGRGAAGAADREGRGLGAVTVSGVGCVVICGAVLIVT